MSQLGQTTLSKAEKLLDSATVNTIFAEYKEYQQNLSEIDLIDVPTADLRVWLRKKTLSEKRSAHDYLRDELSKNSSDTDLMFRLGMVSESLFNDLAAKYWFKKAAEAPNLNPAACAELLSAISSDEKSNSDKLFESAKKYPKTFYYLFLAKKDMSLLDHGVAQNCNYALAQRGCRLLLDCKNDFKMLQSAMKDLDQAARRGSHLALVMIGYYLLNYPKTSTFSERGRIAQDIFYEVVKSDLYSLSCLTGITQSEVPQAFFRCVDICQISYKRPDHNDFPEFEYDRHHGPTISFFEAVAFQNEELFLRILEKYTNNTIRILHAIVDAEKLYEFLEYNYEIAPFLYEMFQYNCYKLLVKVLPRTKPELQKKLESVVTKLSELGFQLIIERNFKMAAPFLPYFNAEQNLAMADHLLKGKPSDEKVEIADCMIDIFLSPVSISSQDQSRVVIQLFILHFLAVATPRENPKIPSETATQATHSLVSCTNEAKTDPTQKAAVRTRKVTAKFEAKADNLFAGLSKTLQSISVEKIQTQYPILLKPAKKLMLYASLMEFDNSLNIFPFALLQMIFQYASGDIEQSEAEQQSLAPKSNLVLSL